MISKTELKAYGFSNSISYDDQEGFTFDWFSESGKVSINMEQPDISYSICIYTDVVDIQGEQALQGVVEILKPTSLTIDEFINFVKFLEDETF